MTLHVSWSPKMDQVTALRAVHEAVEEILVNRLDDSFPTPGSFTVAEMEKALEERVANFVDDFRDGVASQEVKSFYSVLQVDESLCDLFRAKVLADHTPAEIFYCRTQDLLWAIKTRFTPITPS